MWSTSSPPSPRKPWRSSHADGTYSRHDIDCKVDGFGAMQLKSNVVKEA
ncbi:MULTISPECIES: PhnA domain-containing protein [unclassified Streptomyces]|nr:alkylphosphonate utilization protein [Streptomyces sp. NBC_00870]